MKNFYFLYILFCLLFSFNTKAQLSFSPNRGQWDDRILYKIPITQGSFLIDKDGFIFNLNNFKSNEIHNHHQDEETTKSISGQIIHSKFLNNTWKNEVEEQLPTSHYYNYFLNNNPSQWKTGIHDVRKIILKDYYKDINLILKANKDDIEFNFEVKNCNSLNKIKIEITGANSILKNEKGDLIINTQFGKINYSKPIAWQYQSNKKRYIPIEFSIDGNLVQFNILGSAINPNVPIYIDPSITFSTFTGSTSDNWGMTATPDNLGNLYAGGIVFDNGGAYPTTTGVFDSTFNGGEVYTPQPYYGFDIAISKFNADGTELLYGTYLGGSGNETPHSLVVDQENNLYVFGATSSVDFPSSSTAYDRTFNGGNPALNNNLYFSASDIYISKISADGSKLLASTLVGGSGNDGMSSGNLEYNYGDAFRGEIIYGKDDCIYVSSTTNSTDFPTKNAFQSSLKGNQDAIVFKLKNDLSELLWSSYYGGNNEETGNSIQQSSNNNIYMVGGTTSTDLNNPFLGGIADGYILKINSVNGSLVKEKLIGGSLYDQIYFVQIGSDDKVYIYGQSNSQMSITNGKYGIVNSGQFIQKLTADLTNVEWTTKIGSGTNDIEISPTAFLVSNCDEIYISGWGGDVNVYHGKALNSSTNNFPVTNDAFQSTTNGSNFYIAVYAPDMDSLTYATFMGGTISSSCHVDGGTSRFDKNGNIYHAVCAACGGNPNGFTSTPGVYSVNNQSTNCNLAAFKFELNQVRADINIISPDLCVNSPNIFYAVNSNASHYYWDFGDGTYSNLQNPSHTYQNPGKYIVQLSIGASSSCLIGNTIIHEVEVLGKNFSIDPVSNPICKNEEVYLNAEGGKNYEWLPHSYFSNYLIQNPSFKAQKNDSIFVVVSNNCFSDTLGVAIILSTELPLLTSDTTICSNQPVNLNVSNSKNVIWGDNYGFNDINNPSQYITPVNTNKYNVSITTIDDCLIDSFIIVNVIQSTVSDYIPLNLKNIELCIGDNIQLDVNNFQNQTWSPAQTLSQTSIKNPIASPNSTTTYYVEGITIDGCPMRDSLLVSVYYTVPKSNLTDTIFSCKFTKTLINIDADSAKSFSYQFYNPPINQIDSNLFEFDLIDTSKLICVFTNICGNLTDSTIYIPIKPTITAGPDTTVCFGETVSLFVNGAKSYSWNFNSSEFSTKNNVQITTLDSILNYQVIGFDSLNCTDTSYVLIKSFPLPNVIAMEDYLAHLGETVSLNAMSNSNGQYDWYINSTLVCQNCLPAYVQPDYKTNYTVLFTDSNNCKASDKVLIYYDGIIYVPNTFTPSEKDKNNNFFKVEGYNITEFEITIYNRWGAKVFYSNNINESWNGDYNNEPCQVGTYAWKIYYKDISGNIGEKVGHVNLIR